MNQLKRVAASRDRELAAAEAEKAQLEQPEGATAEGAAGDEAEQKSA
jgi:hypothetical protein